ncbi:pyridoxal-dependent decarboxylase domain protein [Teladorsagia circumcincta]|uniref:Pyridoxal-dependent decarboxylase domain protein n=1 Tax=Teladorsagia circumcincta TaxID=45464 RepID=A0A2G9UF40_TELCI|nr:pyridoxal-dependent decarboxylase domain protein [Teladorsagia circumcincta]
MVARFTIEWSDNPVKCSVTSDDLPGTLYNTIPLRAPETPDTFEELLHDIKCKIVTKDDARNSTGGGTVVRSASNAIFYFIMTSKRRKVAQLMALFKKPQSAFRELMQEVGPKLVVYINKDAHPYAEKACAMAMVKCHAIQAKSSNKWSLTGAEVEEQIQQDLAKKLIPLLVYCTVGTTPSAIVDHLESIGPIAKKIFLVCDGLILAWHGLDELADLILWDVLLCGRQLRELLVLPERHGLFNLTLEFVP